MFTPTVYINSLDNSSFVWLAKFLILCFAFLILLLIYPTLKRISNEYYFIILCTIFSSILLVAANDFIVLYLTLELQSFCFFILIGSSRTSLFSIEACLKYFIFSSFSSILLLLGISFIYGVTGSLNLIDLRCALLS